MIIFTRPTRMYLAARVDVDVNTKLWDILAEEGHNASWLANQMGISRERISQLRRGRMPLTYELMARIATVMGRPQEELFEIDQSRFPIEIVE